MSEARGFLGAGNVALNRYNPTTGALEGWTDNIEASVFSIKPNAEIKELVSKGRATYGQVIESVAIQQPADFSMTLREVNRETMTLMFMGEQAAINDSAGSATDEDLTLKAGFGSQLPKRNLSESGFTLTSKPAGTTYVLGTDYTVNWRLGLVTAIPGSALASAVVAAGGAGLTLLVSYAWLATSGARVRGAVRPQLRAQVKFDGVNFADGKKVLAEIYEVILTPSAEFDFLADDWNELPLTGRMKTPVGKGEPFIVDFLD